MNGNSNSSNSSSNGSNSNNSTSNNNTNNSNTSVSTSVGSNQLATLGHSSQVTASNGTDRPNATNGVPAAARDANINLNGSNENHISMIGSTGQGSNRASNGGGGGGDSNATNGTLSNSGGSNGGQSQGTTVHHNRISVNGNGATSTPPLVLSLGQVRFFFFFEGSIKDVRLDCNEPFLLLPFISRTLEDRAAC